MKYLKLLLISSTVLFSGLSLTGCENTSVSGSVSYGMGVGYGYPMYYGPRGRNHTDIIIVNPPKIERPRPNRPKTKPSRQKRR